MLVQLKSLKKRQISTVWILRLIKSTIHQQVQIKRPLRREQTSQSSFSATISARQLSVLDKKDWAKSHHTDQTISVVHFLFNGLLSFLVENESQRRSELIGAKA